MNSEDPPRTTLVYTLHSEITKHYPVGSIYSDGVSVAPSRPDVNTPTGEWWVRTWVSVDDTGMHMGIRVLGPCHFESRAAQVVGALQQEFDHLYGPTGPIRRSLAKMRDQLNPDAPSDL